MMSAGRPRSVSNRANASNGEVVSTPPKSQITASIIPSCRFTKIAGERLTWNALANQPSQKLGAVSVNRYFCSMKYATPLVAATTLLLAMPAQAIVGGGTPSTDGVARSIVTIVGSRGNFCTGSLLAPKIVLTA